MRASFYRKMGEPFARALEEWLRPKEPPKEPEGTPILQPEEGVVGYFNPANGGHLQALRCYRIVEDENWRRYVLTAYAELRQTPSGKPVYVLPPKNSRAWRRND